MRVSNQNTARFQDHCIVPRSRLSIRLAPSYKSSFKTLCLGRSAGPPGRGRGGQLGVEEITGNGDGLYVDNMVGVITINTRAAFHPKSNHEDCLLRNSLVIPRFSNFQRRATMSWVFLFFQGLCVGVGSSQMRMGHWGTQKGGRHEVGVPDGTRSRVSSGLTTV